MKKRILGLLFGVMLVSVCVGCGAENAITEVVETAETTQESTVEQTEVPTATPEEKVEPTPEANTEPVEETTAETEPETTETTEIVAPEPTEEPTPEPEPQATYTYTDMSATMYAQQTVNVRDLPDTSGNKVGSLSTNDEIAISGQCNETGWYRFEYNGNVAFVSNKYVGENKVEVQQQATANSGSSSSGKKNWQEYYQDHVWYDMNNFMFIIVDSRDEGTNYTDYSGANATLEARFPGEKVYSGAGVGLRDGHWMFFSYRAGTLVDSFIEPFM